MAEGKAKHEKAQDKLFMAFADKLFNRGKVFEDGREKIAEGDKQVVKGEAKIGAGEKKLAAGELELNQGKEQLQMAKDVRIACALGVIIFSILSIGPSWLHRVRYTQKRAMNVVVQTHLSALNIVRHWPLRIQTISMRMGTKPRDLYNYIHFTENRITLTQI